MTTFDFDVMDTKTRSESGVEMTIRRVGSGDPLLSRDGKPVKLVLLGPDSETYRSMSRDQMRSRLSRQASGGKEDDATIEADALSILVACTKGWENVNDKDGAAIAFTPEAVRDLYKQFPAIRDQVDIFIGNRSNFTKASS